MAEVSSGRLQVAALGLLALDRLEQRLEVAVAEAARAVALDDLEEDRRAVADRLREDLEEVALVVAVDQDALLAQVGELLDDLWHARRDLVVVGLGDREELDASAAHLGDRADDVARRHRDVLGAGAAVELEVLVDLRLALALGRLVDRELDAPVAARDDLGHQRRARRCRRCGRWRAGPRARSRRRAPRSWAGTAPCTASGRRTCAACRRMRR